MIYTATVGGNLSDGTRFEAGDVLEKLKKSDKEALIEMGALTVDGDQDEEENEE
jgi:hypothetical protein